MGQASILSVSLSLKLVPDTLKEKVSLCRNNKKFEGAPEAETTNKLTNYSSKIWFVLSYYRWTFYFHRTHAVISHCTYRI